MYVVSCVASESEAHKAQFPVATRSVLRCVAECYIACRWKLVFQEAGEMTAGVIAQRFWRTKMLTVWRCIA